MTTYKRLETVSAEPKRKTEFHYTLFRGPELLSSENKPGDFETVIFLGKDERTDFDMFLTIDKNGERTIYLGNAGDEF